MLSQRFFLTRKIARTEHRALITGLERNEGQKLTCFLPLAAFESDFAPFGTCPSCGDEGFLFFEVKFFETDGWARPFTAADVF